MTTFSGIAVVTGANGGLGKATCIELARRGAKVVMICRDGVRGEAAKAEVQQRSGRRDVDLVLADLSCIADVRRLATELSSGHPSISALIHTAAIYTAKRKVTVDGLEAMFATNLLAPHLLTRLLLPALDRGAPATVVVVSAPATTRPDFDDLQGAKRFRSLWAFGATMVGKLMFAFALTRRVDGKRLTVFAVHPGLMKSDLTREMPRPLRFAARIFSRSPDPAARYVADLATGGTSLRTGSFAVFGKLRKAPAVAADIELQERMWRATAKLALLPSEPAGGEPNPAKAPVTATSVRSTTNKSQSAAGGRM